MNSHKIIWPVLAFAIILILGVAGFFYYQPRYETSMQKGGEFFIKKDVRAIAEYEEALKMSETPQERINALISLGSAYLLMSDYDRGIATLRDASLDGSYPPFFRALAAHYLLSFYVRNPDEALKGGIFKGPVWGEFARNAELGDFNAIAERGYEWIVSEITPIYPAEYFLAARYGVRAERTSGKERQTYLSRAEEKLSIGNNLLYGSTTTPAQSIGSQGTVAWALQSKIIATSALSRLAPKKYTEKDLEHAFNEANRAALVSEKIDDSPLAHEVTLSVRLIYSLALARLPTAQKEETRQKIRELIAPIIDETTLDSYLRDAHDAVHLKPLLANVAKIEPRFEEKLLALGWQASDFSSQ